MTLEFARPAVLALVALIAAVFVLARGGRTAIPRPDVHALPKAPRLIAEIPLALRLLSLACIVIALAGPRSRGGEVHDLSTAAPIAIAIDVSSSMLARDLSTTGDTDRLAIARTVVERFIAERPDQPVALVAFAAEAITLVPLTDHQRILRRAVRDLRVGVLDDGTALGDGLATAINRVRGAPGAERAVIVMSDGAGNRGETSPLEAAAAAAALGIPVFTIGVGADGPTRVPVVAGEAGVEYVEAAADIDEETLKEIARATGGEYHRAADPAMLQRVYSRIDQLVRSPYERRLSALYRDWSALFIALALALLGLEWAVRGSRWGVVP